MDDMNLAEVTERLAALDIEVRESQDAEFVDSAIKEKSDLIARKAELEDLENRKQIALDINDDVIVVKTKEERKGEKKDMFENMTFEEVRATPEYRNAFLKGLLGQPLSEVEKRANEMAVANVAGVIPTLTQERIFNKLKEHAPLLDEITLLQVPGNVTFAVEGTNNAAALHAENTAITPAADVMVSVTLGGFEIVKVLRISATVQAMAIGAFETWLVDYLAEAIGIKIGAYLIYGTGQSQPKGIDYMKVWADTTNAVQWAGAAPTVAEFVEAMGYLKGGYHRRAKWLMNPTTLWSILVPIQDNSKFKILSDDYTRFLGKPILLDDNVVSNDVFFGDFKKIVANLSQNIKVDRSAESGFLNNAIDYRGTAIFDCDLAVDECFVKIAAAVAV